MKKLVSKCIAMFMAVAMVIAMNVTAFAETTPTGTLTINNTVAGKTLDLYQVFTATKTGDNVAYTLNTAYEGFFQSKLSSSETGEALSEAAYRYVKEQVGTDGSSGANFAKELLTWILANTNKVKSTHQDAITADKTTKIENLSYGYYVVYPLGATDTSAAPGEQHYTSTASLVSVTGDTSVNMKSNYPTVVKKVNNKNATDVNIGDEVIYTLTSKVPDMTGYTSYVFNFKDTLSEGLTFKQITSVKVGDTNIASVEKGQEANNTYTLTKTENKDEANSQKVKSTDLVITMNNFKESNKEKTGETITVTYTATLNAAAKKGFDPNTNSASVEYSNNPSQNTKGESEPSVVDVHTFDFTIFKYYTANGEDGEKNTGLAGAKFELYTANGDKEGPKINIVDESNGVYRQATVDEAKSEDFKSALIVSDSDGKVLVKGLKAGTYYLKETEAPSGYNKLLSDIKVEIIAKYDETTGKLTNYSVNYTYNGNKVNASDDNGNIIKDKNNSPVVPVENKTGAQLPNTGARTALLVTLAGVVLFAIMAASSIYSKRKEAR